MNRDHGCDSGDQEREDQRWRDEERERFLSPGAPRGKRYDPLRALIEWVSERDHGRAVALDAVVHEIETAARLASAPVETEAEHEGDTCARMNELLDAAHAELDAIAVITAQAGVSGFDDNDQPRGALARVQALASPPAPKTLAHPAPSSLASWLDEQIAEAARELREIESELSLLDLVDDSGSADADVAHARLTALREVRARLGGDDDTRSEG